jgi:hypothetical protein
VAKGHTVYFRRGVDRARLVPAGYWAAWPSGGSDVQQLSAHPIQNEVLAGKIVPPETRFRRPAVAHVLMDRAHSEGTFWNIRIGGYDHRSSPR